MRSRESILRDQEQSPFALILEDFRRSAGLSCSALVDGEGETVDYAGLGKPFEIRIMAAELRLLLQLSDQGPALHGPKELLIRAKRKSLFIRALPEGYALVAELPRRAGRISRRPLLQAIRRLCQEAGFDLPSELHREGTWARVQIEEESGLTKRPKALLTEGVREELEVLGRLAQLDRERSRREQGFRIRLESGLEANLIREPLGRWYLEEQEEGWG